MGAWRINADITTFNRLTEILGVDLNYFSENFQSAAAEIKPVNSQEKQSDKLPLAKQKNKLSWDMSRGNWVDADFSGLKNLKEKFSSSNMQRCKFTDSDLSGLLLKSNQKLEWNDSLMAIEYRDRPGTYDDIYMDLSFMKVIEEEGVDAPAQSFAESFAHADYKLWFANQTARYNILNGLTPPESGHWLNNPCADDIDFQIEADFAGLMFPGMINSAVELCDKVGHIIELRGWLLWWRFCSRPLFAGFNFK